MIAWHRENMTGLDIECGLMRDAFAALGLAGSQRWMFKMKLAVVHEAATRMAAEEKARRETRRGH